MAWTSVDGDTGVDSKRWPTGLTIFRFLRGDVRGILKCIFDLVRAPGGRGTGSISRQLVVIAHESKEGTRGLSRSLDG